MVVYKNGVAQGISNTDAEIRDGVWSDSNKAAGADVGTIKGHTDKIDDATNGLTAIKAEVEGLGGSAMVGTNSATLAATWTDAKAAFLDENISAAKTLTVAERTAIRKSVCLPGDTVNSVGKALYELYVNRITATRAGHLDELDFDLNARLGSPAGASLAVDIANLPNNTDIGDLPWDETITGHNSEGSAGLFLNNIDAQTKKSIRGNPQTYVKSVTSAANAGDVVLATVATHPCIIDSIVIHADTASQTDLTSAAVSGGAGKVVTFIDATDAAKANLDAIDEQVAWTGAVHLAATKTIVMSLVGTGVTAVDLTVVINYHAEADGGSIG